MMARKDGNDAALISFGSLSGRGNCWEERDACRIGAI